MSAAGTPSLLVHLYAPFTLDTTEAACIGYPPDLWFPKDGDQTGAKLAVSICRECPIQAACAEVALTSRIQFGVFGALTAAERARILKRAQQEERMICKICGGPLAPNQIRAGFECCSRHCSAKYRILKRYGTEDDRFQAKINKDGPDGCWLWTGEHHVFGYGYVTTQTNGVRTRRLAHRVAYEKAYGPIEDPKLVVMHACDNPPCVNPDHLTLGSQADNIADMIAKGRRSVAGLEVGWKLTKPLTADDPRHGTTTGYAAHHRIGEKACTECLTAWSEKSRANREHGALSAPQRKRIIRRGRR